MLAARDPDSDDLINILFVVVIGIAYAIGGFIKAKAKKAGQQEEPQEAKAAESRQRMQLYKDLVRGKPVEHELSYGKPQNLRVGQREAAQKIEDQLKRLKKPVEVPKEDFSAKPPETIAPEPRIQSFLSLGSAEDLKKAFLYYEVLGKPVGFRD